MKDLGGLHIIEYVEIKGKRFVTLEDTEEIFKKFHTEVYNHNCLKESFDDLQKKYDNLRLTREIGE
jgi:hypothetical protein